MEKRKLSDFLKRLRRGRRLRFWYLIPRALYPTEPNIHDLQKVFGYIADRQYYFPEEIPAKQMSIGVDNSSSSPELRKWKEKDWLKVFQWMISERIIKPQGRKQKTSDQLANVRNYRNLITKIGFGYVNKQGHLFVSEIGYKFLYANAQELPSVFEEQLCRLQFFNPSLDQKDWKAYSGFKLFPYLTISKLLLKLENKELSAEEFTLFVSSIRSDSEIDEVRELIEDYRKLGKQDKVSIKQSAKIKYPEQTNTSVHLQLFGLTPSLVCTKANLVVTDESRLKAIVGTFSDVSTFVHYQNFEDWYAYIGAPPKQFDPISTADYYSSIGHTDKAEKLLKEYENDLPPGITFQEAVQRLFLEKQLEDYLEKNLSAINSDLVFVERQKPTEIGRIDLLTQRSSDDGYVVIELKRGHASDDVIGQCLRYMGWVRDNLSSQRLVRGVIIGDIDPKLELAKHGMQHPVDDIIILRPLDDELKNNAIKLSA